MKTISLADAKDYFPTNGNFQTECSVANIKYEQDFENGTVVLNIDDQIFGVSDLKELRKFLKLLITEFES